ncbi:MAG: hypothetical protein HN475_09295 [Piscirickettsiaceae bacterium]|nr:hypothetical protein [Piscirickettsiaceae bacterium]
MMYHLQQTDTSGKVHLIPAIKVSMTATEISWLIEGLDALVLPSRSKRVKRSLKRALTEIEKENTK